MIEQYLIRVTAPHFVAGLIVTTEPRISSSAPILRRLPEPRIIRSAPILRRYRSWGSFIQAASDHHWEIQHCQS